MAREKGISTAQLPDRILLAADPLERSSTPRVLLGLFCVVLASGSLYLLPRCTAYGLIFLGLGVPLVVLVWLRPEFGLLGLLFLTSSFISADIVDVRLPIGGGLDLRDLVLIGLFGLVSLRELARRKLTVPWWPVGGPLLLFLALAVFSTFYALVFRNVESNWALGDLRILSTYVTFYVVQWSIERPKQLKTLLVGLFMIADLTTAIIYLQQFAGAANPLLRAMTMTRDWRVDQEAGAVRVIPAGHVLMHYVWFIAFGILVFGRRNRRLTALCVLQLLFIGGGHILTYTRAQWMAMGVGLGLAGIILVPRCQRLVKAAAIGGCVLLLLAGVVVAVPRLDVSALPLVDGLAERFGSLLRPSDTLDTGSLQWRSFEMMAALKAIRRHPLTGVGLGGRYRDLTIYQGEAQGYLTRGSLAAEEVSRFTRYVHNSYLAIAVKMGLPGLAVLLWFCAAALFRGLRVLRDVSELEYRGVVLGALAGFAGMFLWCYFHAHLIKAESTGVIALMAGLVGSVAHVQGFSLVSRPIRDRWLSERR